MAHNLFDTLQTFEIDGGRAGQYYSLPQLEKAGVGSISRLPVSIRIVLESVLRNYDGQKILEKDIYNLAGWKPNASRTDEIPFVVARIVLQDFTGVPLLADLAAMRSAIQKLNKNPGVIEPLVPVDLVVDHSVQVDFSGDNDALRKNMELEFERNAPRYQFMKWGMQAFKSVRVVPPGTGIVHQVNLEYLAQGVLENEGVYYPDTVVGTDSHTTMINGLGIVGWGVGGIEAEAGMLGQPVYFLTPDVVGVNLTGALREGITATDMVLTITETLRKHKVVGKFCEFFGDGASSLSLTDRATIANMAPEYGATMGFFPVDDETIAYLRATGRSDEQVETVKAYCKAQGIYGFPIKGDIDYSSVVEIDLASIEPSVAGPKRPQDRVRLVALKETFNSLLAKPVAENGYGKAPSELTAASVQVKEHDYSLNNGDVLIAAITSCTNTSNPGVLLAAGLVAKKAVERGLSVSPKVKTSIAPGSRVVTEYLKAAGLQPYLDTLGFNIVAYGCTTCIGNSGPLDQNIEEAVLKGDLVTASVLSGNRNFEARIHPNIKANFLMSPPLVVAFALAGRIDIDLTTQPVGKDKEGNAVYLKDIWPTNAEVKALLGVARDPKVYRRLYGNFVEENDLWMQIPSNSGDVYEWDRESTYIQEPPFFLDLSAEPSAITNVTGGKSLAIFGDSITTDHISPAASIKKNSPAGKYLLEKGVAFEDFNTYGTRRGNDRVMLRGTFANVRIKNQMVPGVEGGVTIYQPTGEQLPIFDAAMKYLEAGTPLFIFAGQEYGTGSSRDWAAKGTSLLGVKVVVAESFERIHRNNLVGMGVLPCQFKEGVNARTLQLDGTESYELLGLEDPNLKPQQDVTLVIKRANGETLQVPVISRIDTPIELEYYRHGGILSYVFRQLVAKA
ncbi:MAG: aconitate hydratase AcnA [Chloroflexi bacterium]|uniref:Aconitate hydratase n=1 Tax=Candidatus Chlorohelix allophototropha TaxID=3003348 RepID=A0A8T7LTM6_9CHLR|nr:aconitate hydratase AcnA [Chloroflexota bacterium]WJW67260.1 aconitate hydratase AcnA [Chloroflexota bacterium L227-S17]